MDSQTFQIKEEKDYTPSDFKRDIYEKEWFRYIKSNKGEFYIKESLPLDQPSYYFFQIKEERDYATSDSKIYIFKEGKLLSIEVAEGEFYIKESPFLYQHCYEVVYRTDTNDITDKAILDDILRKYSKAWKILAKM